MCFVEWAVKNLDILHMCMSVQFVSVLRCPLNKARKAVGHDQALKDIGTNIVDRKESCRATKSDAHCVVLSYEYGFLHREFEQG